MKTIIAGGRDYQFTKFDELILRELHFQWGFTEVVSGGAVGADSCGEAWAAGWANLPIKQFKADWDNHGIKAGPIRNRQMAEYADLCILFPGGKGTASMKREAERMLLPIIVIDCKVVRIDKPTKHIGVVCYKPNGIVKISVD